MDRGRLEQLEQDNEVMRRKYAEDVKLIAALEQARASFHVLFGINHLPVGETASLDQDVIERITQRVLARLPGSAGKVVYLNPVPALEEVFHLRGEEAFQAKAQQLVGSLGQLSESQRELLALLVVQDHPLPIQEAARLLCHDIRNSGGAHGR